MPVTCIVVNCVSRADREYMLSYFRIPRARNSPHYPHVNELSRKRREMWLAALKRENLTESMIKNQRICSRHFLTGRPSSLTDENHPDWVPSQHMDLIQSRVRSKHKSGGNKKLRADKRTKLNDEAQEPRELTWHDMKQHVNKRRMLHPEETLAENDEKLFGLLEEYQHQSHDIPKMISNAAVDSLEEPLKEETIFVEFVKSQSDDEEIEETKNFQQAMEDELELEASGVEEREENPEHHVNKKAFREQSIAEKRFRLKKSYYMKKLEIMRSYYQKRIKIDKRNAESLEGISRAFDKLTNKNFSW